MPPKATSALCLAGFLTAIFMALGAGFCRIGTPSQQRLIALDAIRSLHLSLMDSYVRSYWRREGTLPGTLSDLDAALVQPTDPVTREPYRYRVTGERGYRLCAEFESRGEAIREPAPGDDYSSTVDRSPHDTFREHGPGSTCFDRDASKTLERGWTVAR